MSDSRLKVLVSEPQAHAQEPYLPYIWAVLKTYCERNGHTDGQVRWLEPIYRKDSATSLLEPYQNTTPDVLGLSCYVWNWELQCRIARSVKARNPRCLVVAGGPHPDYKDPCFFLEHPFIDIVAVKDGEITFDRILSKVLHGNEDYRDIGGLYLPAPGQDHICTGAAEVPITFEESPYLEQTAFYQEVRKRHGTSRLDAIWETNRGCPYACSFCDWGSNTMSKIRRFGMERITREIDWFARMEIHAILLTDANFGILPRDVELAQRLNEAKSRHGHPRFVHYSPAKNNPDRTVEIARSFAAGGISPVYPFAVQHTNEEVLAATDRANISIDKQRSVARTVTQLNIPTLVQLILGIPGDTYELWRTCLTDLMDWGLHDNYQVFDYTLLPNAPAAEKAFRDRWEIETIRRWLPKMGTGRRRSGDMDALDKLDIIVKTKTYSRDDWVRMKVFAAFVRALHNCGLTRYIAMYLHFSHGVGYRELYDQIIDEYFASSGPYRKLTQHFYQFLQDENAVEDLELEQFPEHPMCFEPGRWLFVQLCWDLDAHLGKLKTFLSDRFPDATNLESAVDYQLQLVKLPSYDSRVGKSCWMAFDWVSYFERARGLTCHQPLAEPRPTPGAVLEVSDRGPDVDWADAGETERWLRWIEQTREVGRTFNTSFRQVRLREA